MSFLHPQLLWLLLLPAALLLASCLPSRVRAAATPPHPRIPRARRRHGVRRPGPGPGPRSPRLFATCASLAFLVLALARPQGATLAIPTVTEARDVLVAVDVSRSMLADDVAPSRLARARLLVGALTDDLRGERLGLLPFAGTAFLQCPLSADYEIFRTFLDELGPDMIPAGGSDFTALLTAADEAFGPADPGSVDAPPPADRYLIILSDGEAQDDTWKPLAQKLTGRGVRILSLGLGTAGGAMIPDGKGGLVKDERGAAVLSRLNASTLQELARITDGAYRDASAWVDLPALLRETVARGRAAKSITDTAPRREELFAWLLAPALVFLALALLREFPVTPRARPVVPPKLPVRHAASFALFLSLLGLPPAGQSARAAGAPAEAPPDPLVDLVGQLASAADVAPGDLARLATLTADQGEKARAENKPAVPEGALRDALAAVEQGRAAAPSAADWSSLRSRLQTLLAPPPPPPKPDKSQQPKNDSKNDPKNGSKDEQPKDESKKEPSDSSQKSPDDKSSQSSPSPQKDQNTPGESKKPDSSPASSSSSPDGKSGSPSPGADDGNRPSGSPPPASDGKPLGDLAQKPESPETKPEQPGTTAAGKPQDPPAAPEETQRAGGVSASGQSSGDENRDALLRLDPSLAIPQQRLERVRDSDAPARLYQLLQESENPPDTRRPSGAPTRDW